MQALRRTTGTAASLLRCALQPGVVGVWRQAVAPLQLQGVRWMVAKVNKGETTPLLEALTMVRTQAKAKFDEAYAPRPPFFSQPAGHQQPGFRGSRSLLRCASGGGDPECVQHSAHARVTDDGSHVCAMRSRSVDVVLTLNVDPRKQEQALRGLAVLPHGHPPISSHLTQPCRTSPPP